MSKKNQVSRAAADLAIAALKEKRQRLATQSEGLDKELQAPGAVANREKLDVKEALDLQIAEIDRAVQEIQGTQKIQGGCSS